jgi:ABC-type sugar transport system substrate-binding protein/anti-anti-sigma regulatory factor
MADPRALANAHIGVSYFGPRYGYFWWIVTHCIRQEARRLGVKTSTVPAASPEHQVETIRRLLREHVDALILTPLRPSDPELVAAVVQANAVGVPVVTLDSEIRGCKLASVIRSEDAKGAQMTAEHLFRQLGGKGKVVHLQGDLRAQAAGLRSEGVHQALAQYPDIELVWEAEGDWTREMGADLMRKALAAHADVGVVLAGNDFTALGACDAIAEAGLTDKIVVAGFDALPEALLAVRNGQMLATVGRSVEDLAHATLEVTLQAMRREEVPPVLHTAVELVTSDNLLESAAVTLRLMPEVFDDLIQSHEAQRNLQQEVIEAQKRAIQELSTPVIPLIERIIVMPLIGTIDTLRAGDIMRALLQGIRENRAQVVILDITGVPLVDTAVANHLVKTVQAARLKGARTIITGISDAVAETLVDLGVDWSEFETLADLQTGLIAALDIVGLKLRRG